MTGTNVGSGGFEEVFSGGTASNTTINGGTMELTTGGSAGTGPITFQGTGGRLQLDDTSMPSNVISGFAAGDTINLAAVNFDPAGSATLGYGNLLKITENGSVYNLQLNPSQSFVGQCLSTFLPTRTTVQT